MLDLGIYDVLRGVNQKTLEPYFRVIFVDGRELTLIDVDGLKAIRAGALKIFKAA